MVRKTRLAKKQEAKNIRQAVIYIILTLALGLVLVFVGIPLLIRMAIFLGNVRTTSKLPEQTDTISPSPPRIIVPFEATNSAQLSLEGYTEPGATIKIYNSGLSFGETVADNEGSFTIDNLKLTSGRNEITAIAQDVAGNESQPSVPSLVDFDTTPPALEIIHPEDGETITGLESQITLEGRTEEEVKIYVNDRLVIVGPEGDFNYQYSLKEGENIFVIIAQDKAGNQAEKELKVTYSP